MQDATRDAKCNSKCKMQLEMQDATQDARCNSKCKMQLEMQDTTWDTRCNSKCKTQLRTQDVARNARCNLDARRNSRFKKFEMRMIQVIIYDIYKIYMFIYYTKFFFGLFLK